MIYSFHRQIAIHTEQTLERLSILILLNLFYPSFYIENNIHEYCNCHKFFFYIY